MARLFKALCVLALVLEPSSGFMPVQFLAKPRIQALSASIQEDVVVKIKEAMKAKDTASLPTVQQNQIVNALNLTHNDWPAQILLIASYIYVYCSCAQSSRL